MEMHQGEKPPAPPAVPQTDPGRAALLTLLGLALSSDDCAREIGDLLPSGCGDEKDTLWKALNILVAGALNGDGAAASAAGINELLNTSPDPELGTLLLAPPSFADPARALRDSVAEFLRISRRRRYAAIMAEIRSCADPTRRQELLRQLQEVLKEQ